MNTRGCRVSEIAGICGGTMISGLPGDPEVQDILIDSRRLVHAGGTLFAALVTTVNDGHRYIPDLLIKGVRFFLVSEDEKKLRERIALDSRFSSGPDGKRLTESLKACFVVVNDTLGALQTLAAWRRQQFSYPVIGITGSNGKTIVKEWLFQALCDDFQIVRSPKSYNSQVGVPLSVWKMSENHTLGIFEAGISRPGEMERLQQVIRPTIGIITNIGFAHDEHFSDHRQKTLEKLKLFRESELLVYCSDHRIIHEGLEGNPGFEGVRRFTWAKNRPADLRLVSIRGDENGTVLEVDFSGNPFQFHIPFRDDASVENAMQVAATLFAMQIPGEIATQRLSRLAPIAMRLELKEAINHCALVNDSYNSDFNSLVIALDFLKQQSRHKKKTIILSDLLETGKDKQQLFTQISELLISREISRIIGIGPDMVKYGYVFPMESELFQSTSEFLMHFPFSSFQNEIILLKGARLFEFERISQALEQKAHETVMEINLDALTHNLNYYRSLIRNGTRIMAMVKAFSYGSGSFEIAKVLQYHGVDYLSVAYADEGVELRQAGITVPVMVMSPEEQSLETLLKFNLEPEIYNLHILGRLERAMESHFSSIQQEVCVHIKLDTGMHRLGFTENELEALIPRLQRNPALRVQSVFTHLASSEDPGDDDFTIRQISQFDIMSKKLMEGIGYPVLRHVLNSAGISRFANHQYEMVRLGIGLYGVGHDAASQRNLRNVSTLRSVITQIKRVPAGDSIGYNRKGRVSRDSLIAVIPVGYADGFDRRLGNGRGVVYIGGRPAPVIGNVCMDLTMIDITSLPDSGSITEGTPVILFGDQHPVAEMADAMGTIPYEVLTGISRRVKRIYFYE